MKNVCALFTVIIVLAVSTAVFAGDVVVIANKDVGLSSASRTEIQQIFLGKVVNWSNGKKAIPVTLKSGSVHENFLKTYLGKSPSQFDTFWKQAIFTGTGRPPKSLKSESEIVKFVASTEGAVGYIDESTAHSGVTVLTVN